MNYPNCDQRYDEDRESEMIDAIRDAEDAAIIAAFKASGMDVQVARYTSMSIYDVIVHHRDVSAQQVADVLSAHTGDTWRVNRTQPEFARVPGDVCLADTPVIGTRINLVKERT